MTAETSKLMSENVKLKQAITLIMDSYKALKQKQAAIQSKVPNRKQVDEDQLVIQENRMLKQQMKQRKITLVNKEREIAELELQLASLTNT